MLRYNQSRRCDDAVGTRHLPTEPPRTHRLSHKGRRTQGSRVLVTQVTLSCGLCHVTSGGQQKASPSANTPAFHEVPPMVEWNLALPSDAQHLRQACLPTRRKPARPPRVLWCHLCHAGAPGFRCHPCHLLLGASSAPNNQNNQNQLHPVHIALAVTFG